jgi:hypothetical protein
MQVTIRSKEFVTVNKDAEQRIAKCITERLCCACLQPLNETRTIRGCHEACYRATKRAIARGIFTDAERTSEGKWLEEESGGRPPTNPVTIEAREKAS